MMRYVGQDLLIYCRTSYQDAEFSLDQNDLILRQKLGGSWGTFFKCFSMFKKGLSVLIIYRG